MPSLFQSKKQSKEAKRRLENLLVLAKDNPDKVFDLSSCELNVLPSIFAQCRVFLTETLLLHSNAIRSLKEGGKIADLTRIRVLDLHKNSLKILPEDIGSLLHLQVLNVENNRLTEFPPSIGQLHKLQTLLAKDNFLNCLPNDVAQMASLRTLDISGTNEVYFLPKALCHIQTLEVLVLSKPHCMEYPPAIVATEGLEAIQRFLCKVCGIEYVPPSHAVHKVLDQVDGPSSISQNIIYEQAKSNIEQYQRFKDEKLKQQLELERQATEETQKQALLSIKTREAKNKEQALIKQENEQLGKIIKEQQAKKNQERAQMVEKLKQVESDASNLVSMLLSVNEKARQQEALLEKMERQRMEQEEYFKVTQDDLDKLRKKDTLDAMEKTLAENDQYNILIQKYLGEQSYAIRKAQQSFGEDDEKIHAELKKQQTTQGSLIEQILSEEYLQKEAFATLQFQQDAVQIRLVSQIRELEEELIKLTHVEARRQKMKANMEQETLDIARNELTDLLMLLLKEKDQREEMLKDRLVDMEKQRQDDQVDFWLVQYQRLLDSKPEILLQKEHALDIEVISLLRKADAGHHIPNFAKHKITADNLGSLDDKQLMNIGVFEVGIRQTILCEINNLIARLKKVDIPYEKASSSTSQPVTYPSSPTSKVVPSAPSETSLDHNVENECVICMDRSSDCVLLPCGHVCSCYLCSISIKKCPMCRVDITQKIRIFRS